jgi:hypothetical protein
VTQDQRLALIASTLCLIAACAANPGPSSADQSPSIGLSPSPVESASPSPSASPWPRGELARDEAIAIAKDAIDRIDARHEVLAARLETWGDRPARYSLVSPPPEPTRVVWYIDIGYQPSPTGGEGWEIVLDAQTGEVLSLLEWIS